MLDRVVSRLGEETAWSSCIDKRYLFNFSY